MTVPMIEVFLPDDSKIWQAVAEPINSMDKIEWFEANELDEGWEKIHSDVLINGRTKAADIFLSSDNRGWINWRDFSPPLT